MKDITTKILEGKSGIYNEIQNEIDTNAAYHTLDISTGKSKYKFGYMSFNEEGEFIGIIGFNTSDDFQELLNAPENKWEDLDSLNITDFITIDDELFVRIW